ncbi:MAG: Spy/CpxP family protein refolding chaperone [Planctomycetota bacterium]|jgi:Spy/CpxP family protein refolding chaperone
MKTKTLVIATLLLAVILAPLAIAEEPAPRGPRGGQGGPGARPGRGGFGGQPNRAMMPSRGMGEGNLTRLLLGRMGERLNLTDEQKEQIETITEENKKKAEKARSAVRKAMKALFEATEEGGEAEIIAAGKAVGDAYTEQALQRSKVAKKIKDILNEEQLTQFEEMKAQMKERMQQRGQGEQRRSRPQDGRGAGQGQGGQRQRGQGRDEGQGKPGISKDFYNKVSSRLRRKNAFGGVFFNVVNRLFQRPAVFYPTHHKA